MEKIGKQTIIWICLMLLAAYSSAQTIYTLENLPNPKEMGQDYFVSNPDQILDSHTVQTLNSISVDIEKESSAEYAIVIVDDYQGDDDFQFAFDLFNKWGIGKKEANNGLLLFIAKNKRQYRFISGYGMESVFPDAYLKRVGEDYLVPNFKNEDYNNAVLEASQFIAQILKSPDSLKELERQMPDAMPFFNWNNPVLKNTLLVLCFFFILYLYIHFIGKKLKSKDQNLKPIAPIFYGIGCMFFLMFITVFIFAFVFNNIEEVYQKKNIPYFAFVLGGLILAMKINDTHDAIKKSYKDEEDKGNALKKFAVFGLIPSIVAPLALFNMGGILGRLNKNRNRFYPPDDSGTWERIKRSSNKTETNKYLDKGNQKEEKISSRQYEIWRNTKSNKIKLIPWDIKKKFSECPECHYFTLDKNKSIEIKEATYSSTGKGKIVDECENCEYSVLLDTFVIPKKTRSTSSSGGSSRGGSSSGGSSSGGGSFGGGSSGGGGAGGRW